VIYICGSICTLEERTWPRTRTFYICARAGKLFRWPVHLLVVVEVTSVSVGREVRHPLAALLACKDASAIYIPRVCKFGFGISVKIAQIPNQPALFIFLERVATNIVHQAFEDTMRALESKVYVEAIKQPLARS
jgi:hypothetical protein